MEEIKKLVETWEVEKGSFIPNAPIYGMFIQELKDAIERQEQINKLTIPVVGQRSEQLKAFLLWIDKDYEMGDSADVIVRDYLKSL